MSKLVSALTQAQTGIPKEGADDTMSKLVGALLLELVDDVPDKPGFESLRADLLAACQVYDDGKKKDLALRFYLAIRSLLHLLDRLEKMEGARNRNAVSGSDSGKSVPYHEPGTTENHPAPEIEGHH
jgi:hypothetical protein